MSPEEFKSKVPTGYRTIAKYFDRRARKAVESISATADELSTKIQKSFRKASAAAKVSQISHGVGPLVLLGTAIVTVATGGTAIPVAAAIGLWGVAEVGSATYAIKSGADANALEEKQKKLAPPAPQ